MGAISGGSLLINHHISVSWAGSLKLTKLHSDNSAVEISVLKGEQEEKESQIPGRTGAMGNGLMSGRRSCGIEVEAGMCQNNRTQVVRSREETPLPHSLRTL